LAACWWGAMGPRPLYTALVLASIRRMGLATANLRWGLGKEKWERGSSLSGGGALPKRTRTARGYGRGEVMAGEATIGKKGCG